MKKIFVSLIVVVISSFCVYAEETGKEDISVTSKLAEIEIRIDTLSSEMKKMQDDIEKIQGSIKSLTNSIRDLQIFTQGAASVKPSEDVWKSIKKGMAGEDVKDILGIPDEILMLREGGEVWYYYGLGSITVDRNGRVVSQQTFKQWPVEKKVR